MERGTKTFIALPNCVVNKLFLCVNRQENFLQDLITECTPYISWAGLGIGVINRSIKVSKYCIFSKLYFWWHADRSSKDRF